MEDLITILIIVIGVALKIHGALKKNRPAEDAPVDKETWQELFGDGSTVEPFAPVQEKAPVETVESRAAAAERAQREAAMLDAQRRYMEMAKAAEERNRASVAGESSLIYQSAATSEEDDAEKSPEVTDWADFIRNNPAGSVIAGEILARPAALR